MDIYIYTIKLKSKDKVENLTVQYTIEVNSQCRE
jgi:hypothetical protein